uniref:Uncharacterized protein n=1 Tax=Rhizophora mucronata TaxID=61149 RepID=A0A2P2LRV8_RHIMU
MPSRLNPFTQHLIEVPFSHHVPPSPQNHLKKSIITLNTPLHTQFLHSIKYLDSLLNYTSLTIAINQQYKKILIPLNTFLRHI